MKFFNKDKPVFDPHSVTIWIGRRHGSCQNAVKFNRKMREKIIETQQLHDVYCSLLDATLGTGVKKEIETIKNRIEDAERVMDACWWNIQKCEEAFAKAEAEFNVDQKIKELK